MSNQFRKFSGMADIWMNYLPPFRPSTNNLKIFADVIRSYFIGRIPKAMVLGATPELRDILYELGASVTVVDGTPEMIHQMSKLRVYKSDETIVIDDWLNFLSSHKRCFDLIVSDLTQGYIPFEKRSDFYKSVSEALTWDGLFIDKLFVFRNSSQLYKADEELMYYAQVPIVNFLTLNEIRFKCFFASDLTFQLGKVDFCEIYSLIRKKHNSPVLYKYIELIKKYLVPNPSISYYGKYWDEVSTLYFQRLELLSEFISPESVYKGILCILISKPK